MTATEPLERTSAHEGLSVLFDRVLVRPGDPEGERRSRAGILIPATAVAVGPHVRTVKVGDEVLYNPEDRFDVELHGEEYVILRERDIHAVATRDNGAGPGLYL
jgi:chaperonin GroES